MAIKLNEETKVVTRTTYNRCRQILISSIRNSDNTYSETVTQQYEKIVEIDGQVVSKTDDYVKSYDCSYLCGTKWTTPSGKELTGLDVLLFIKHFNDNYEEMLTDAHPQS